MLGRVEAIALKTTTYVFLRAEQNDYFSGFNMSVHLLLCLGVLYPVGDTADATLRDRYNLLVC
ncbi:MAG: hypothetical protein F6K23_24530 [Okeania sp. SIO2C9]|uniref:hypothetical protein n=1 Tax=Okeania sp. SIO2C9 TaxID=2607791 RepID=UPI0013BF0924|nr:hypothetical protein [Okeania sp. SIO2C9]NEQ75920.1 hypothetical protein [Okeania sp. SIO2C9]